MSATSPFTDAEDYASLYINLGGGFGLPGAEKSLFVKNKSFDAGNGSDTLYFNASVAKIGSWFTIAGSDSGVITVTNASGGTVKLAHLEKLEFKDVTLSLGTAADNALNGTAKGDGFLFGLAGNDTINGLGGNDILRGGVDNDKLNGGAGADKIMGGSGKDIMSGGAEKDTFDFNSIAETSTVAATRDVIRDFRPGLDKIDLKTIDANAKASAPGDQSFNFIGAVKFHKAAGELNIFKTDAAGTVNDKTIVQGDVNGDGLADFQIELTGLKALASADFIL